MTLNDKRKETIVKKLDEIVKALARGSDVRITTTSSSDGVIIREIKEKKI